jgi:DNA-binding transcriptional LysR family regulator
MPLTAAKDIKLAGVDMNLLVVLEALLEEQNVTRAAQRLNKSQPSVSNGLSRLRHLFNDPLLEREGNGMRLTPAGRSLAPRVKDALDSVRSLLARSDFDPRVGRHRVRACSAENVSLYFQPTMVRHLRTCGVDAEISIHWPNTKEEALKGLSRGKYDLLLGAYLETSDDAERFYLYEEPHVCVARYGHPALARLNADGTLPAEALAPYPITNMAYSGAAGRQFDAAMARLGITVTRVRSLYQLTMAPYTMLGDDTVVVTTERMGAWLARMLPLQMIPAGFELPRFPIEMLVQKSRVQEGWMNWFIGEVLAVAPDAYGVWPERIHPANGGT